MLPWSMIHDPWAMSHDTSAQMIDTLLAGLGSHEAVETESWDS